jgi:uncharacterized protein YjbI with pentapeptide repeats
MALGHKQIAQLMSHRMGLRSAVKTTSVVFHVVVAVLFSITLASCEQLSATPTPMPQPLSADRLETVRLSNQSLRGVNLSAADISGHNLVGADLTGANLSGAILRGAQLDETNLRGANLNNADLTNASLTGAQYDANTRWPEAFDPIDAGAVLTDH